MSPNNADGMANSVDPDQTAGSALFAQACLSENLGKLRYLLVNQHILWHFIEFETWLSGQTAVTRFRPRKDWGEILCKIEPSSL